MEITEVKVYPVEEDKLKAFATIVFDECFIVKDLKVIRGNTGLFVAMPNKKRKDGTFKDTVHPIKPEMRQMIEDSILARYHQEVLNGSITPRAAYDA